MGSNQVHWQSKEQDHGMEVPGEIRVGARRFRRCEGEGTFEFD